MKSSIKNYLWKKSILKTVTTIHSNSHYEEKYFRKENILLQVNLLNLPFPLKNPSCTSASSVTADKDKYYDKKSIAENFPKVQVAE